MACVLVVGSYRTGSSAVAGLLHSFGVFMGEEFDLPDARNPYGYWEDCEFKRLHCKIVANLPDDETKESYKRLVDKRKNHKIWGFKDPCVIFDFDSPRQLIDDECKVIFCRRNNKDVGKSILKSVEHTGNWNLDLCIELAELYEKLVDEIQLKCKDEKLIVNHEELIHNTSDVISSISDFIQLPVNDRVTSFVQKGI